jgi:hypothetical protein
MKNDHSQQLPLARTEQLIVKEVDDEVLVYDLKNDQAHCLNTTAAIVLRHCDGSKSITDISKAIAAELNATVDESVVCLALHQLKRFKLLENSVAQPMFLMGMNRREVVRRLGIATAIALPLVTTMLAPNAVEAASCGQPTNRDPNCPCTSSAQCSSGCCRTVNNKCGSTAPCI